MNDAIQVQVIEARNLKSADLFSKSDPYAELTVLGQRHSGKAERTKTIWNNNSPVWNEAFTMYPQSMNDSLRIQLFDKDVGTKDDYLGEVVIPLNRYYNKGMVDDWLPVMGKGGRSHLFGREKGEIHIKVTYGKGPNVAPTMPAPLPYQQPMAPSNPQGGAKPTQYMGPANPTAAAALGKPPVKSNQQPPPYPGIGKAPVPAPSTSLAPSAPAMAPAASAPLYPPIQPSTASASYPPAQQYPSTQQYPPSTPWGSVPPPQQYISVPPPMNPSMGQYPPTQPPMQSFGPIPTQMQYPPQPQYPPMNQGYPQNPIPPTGFNPIPPFM